MAKEPVTARNVNEGVISIIGPGMCIVGDCQTEGTVRIEGRVEGTIRAKKAVVVGREGSVSGEIHTQDAVVGGSVNGLLVAESRLELQESSKLEGEIRARRIRLDEGAIVNGSVLMGDNLTAPSPPARSQAPNPTPAPDKSPAGEPT